MAGRIKAKQLIVNADDLGLHPSVNNGIFRAHREGIVTSTTILIGGSAFTQAVEGLKDNPELGVGIHLCLVDQEPVSEPEKIRSLVKEGGRLPSSHKVFMRDYLLRKIASEEIYVELESQMAKAIDCGIKPTHIDSHQHLHVIPSIASMVAQLCKKFGIERVRIPVDDPSLSYRSKSIKRELEGRVLTLLAKKARRIFTDSGISSTDSFFGFACGGQFDKTTWRSILPRIGEGVTEIMVHPGDNNVNLSSNTSWKYHWEEELNALTDPEIKSQLALHEIQWINYGDIT